MRKPLIIGNKEFNYKKDALLFYKNILNSYNFDEILSNEDFGHLVDLINYDEDFFKNHDNFIKLGDDSKGIKKLIQIRVTKVQFSTKCFELIFDNEETDLISYILRINKRKVDHFQNFSKASRNSIYEDIRNVKQIYFDNHSKKGYVPCQESGISSKWEELVLDHRQPNSFSIIVDRFIEVNKIILSDIKYKIDENNFYCFKDEMLSSRFRVYHKEKAVLRIVRKELNSKRTHQGRVRAMKKDLKI